MDKAVDVVDDSHGWIIRFFRSLTIDSDGAGRSLHHRGSGGSGRFEVSALCFVPGDVPLPDGCFRFRCESQCGNHGMGRLAGEPRQVPGVAQGAAGVVFPAGERRLDSDVVDLASCRGGWPRSTMSAFSKLFRSSGVMPVVSLLAVKS